MPEMTLATQGLEDKTPAELEDMRRQLVAKIKTDFAGDLDKTPVEWLKNLSAITSSLRKRNAGPPKEAKTKAAKGPKSLDDLLGM